MRFLHVMSTFAPGGPQVRAAQILDQLGSAHRHEIVAMDGNTECRARIAPAVAVELVPFARGGSFLASARAFAALLRARRPDMLLTYNWGAIEALLGARLARFTNVVHHEDGFGPDEAERFLRRRVWARRLLLGGARALIVPSQNLARIAREVWRQPDARVRCLPNGVDLSRFRPVARGARNPVVIGNVASFRGEKNQAMLIEAYARMRGRADARLTLVGDGPDRPACEALCARLGIADRVSFAGACRDTAPAYAGLDVFALSSRTEQMPLVVLEAMASGLPVASPAVGDVEQMVGDRNRPFIVPFVEASALAVSLDALVADRELRAEIGAQNRARCEQLFELRACLDRFVAVYLGG